MVISQAVQFGLNCCLGMGSIWILCLAKENLNMKRLKLLGPNPGRVVCFPGAEPATFLVRKLCQVISSDFSFPCFLTTKA